MSKYTSTLNTTTTTTTSPTTTTGYANTESIKATQLLLIRSRYPYPHALLIRSNLPSQILLYEDADCTLPLAMPLIRRFAKEVSRVYVRFDASLRATHPHMRVVKGGIVIESVVATSRTSFGVINRLIVPV